MKNVYLVQTNKPSRLQLQKVTKELLLYKDSVKEDAYTQPIDMFIISDEELKDGDKYSHYRIDCKKIILTTNQDLIKDGVQAIDDEFLEWFIKNPTCENIEVRKIEDELISPKNPKIRFNALQDPPSFISAESLNNMILTYKYKIIIPRTTQQVIDEDFAGGLEMGQIIPKQETLEEVKDLAYYKANAEEDYLAVPISVLRYISQLEQQEKSYSDEEVLNFTQTIIQQYKFGNTNIEQLDLLKETLKQFKNK